MGELNIQLRDVIGKLLLNGFLAFLRTPPLTRKELFLKATLGRQAIVIESFDHGGERGTSGCEGQGLTRKGDKVYVW